jgi:uncharacterized membrane protein YkvI
MDTESYAKSMCDSLSEGVFNNMFTNPIYVSVLITTTILLIILTMYDDKHVIKTGVYIFLMTLFIVFIHNKLLLIEHRKALCNKDSENICFTIDEGPTTINGGAERLGYLNM